MGRALELAIKLDPAVILQRAGTPADPWQAKLLREDHKRTIMCCGRQIGKTHSAAAKACHTAIQGDKLVLIISPSERQSKETLRTIKKISDKLDMRGMHLEEDSSLRIEFANGSRVIALPDKEANIRGFSSVDLLLIDEASRVSDEVYNAVRPMLSVSAGELLVLSTPFGKRGWFHDVWSGASNWNRIMVKATECPRISAEFLEEERHALPLAWYRQEYFCEFVDTIDSPFTYDMVKAAFSDDVLPLFAPAQTPMSAEVGRLFQ